MGLDFTPSPFLFSNIPAPFIDGYEVTVQREAFAIAARDGKEYVIIEHPDKWELHRLIRSKDESVSDDCDKPIFVEKSK